MLTIDQIKQEILNGNVDALYRSRYWKDKRTKILERDNYECQRCLGKLGKVKHIRLKKANTVHHKVEIKSCPDLMLDDDNLVSLCRTCHDEIHGRTTDRFNKPKKRLTEERW